MNFTRCVYLLLCFALAMAPLAHAQGSAAQPAPQAQQPPPAKPDESTTTFVVLQTSSLTPPAAPDPSCASYVPDYKQYHSILEIVNPERSGETTAGGSMPAGLPVYEANVGGTDPVTGLDRRQGLGSSGFDPLKSTMILRSLVGEPGTRLTFHGDAEHPFSPVPSIRVWDGAIDIDPKCGLMIHAKSAADSATAKGSSAAKSDLAALTLRAQRLLKSLGYDPGSADGKSGARTVEAIKTFQASEKLPVDGRVSPALVKALEARANKSREKPPKH